MAEEGGGGGASAAGGGGSGGGTLRAKSSLAARIKRVLQQDEAVGKIAGAAPVAIERALELFLQKLVAAAAAEATSRNHKTLQASHVKVAVKADPELDFLKTLVEGVADPPAAVEAGAAKPKRQRAPKKEGGDAPAPKRPKAASSAPLPAPAAAPPAPPEPAAAAAAAAEAEVPDAGALLASALGWDDDEGEGGGGDGTTREGLELDEDYD